MTRKKALQVLLRTALEHCEGSGVGLRATPSDRQKAEVVEAVERLWGDAYAFPLSESELWRYGLSRGRSSRPAPDQED